MHLPAAEDQQLHPARRPVTGGRRGRLGRSPRGPRAVVRGSGVRRDRHLRLPVLGRRPADDPVHVGAVDRLLLQQQVDELLELAAVGADQVHRVLLCLAQQPRHLVVDGGLGCLGERPAGKALPATAQKRRPALGIPDRPQRGRQPELADHLGRQVRRAGQVVGGAGRSLPELNQLGGPPAHPDRQRISEVVLAVQVPLVDRQLLGHPEGLAGRQDRDLRHRVGVVRQRGDNRVPGLVDRDRVLLVRQQHVRAFPPAEQDPVPGRVEVVRGQHLAVAAHRVDRRLVRQVGQVGAGEPRRPPGHGVQVDVGTQLLVPAVHREDRGALRQRRQRDRDLPVEPPGP